MTKVGLALVVFYSKYIYSFRCGVLSLFLILVGKKVC